MVHCVERYVIPGAGSYGIEDYESPGLHFFLDEYLSGRCKRFRLWRNGCGVGQADSLEEARQLIHDYARHHLQDEFERLDKTLAGITASRKKLGDDVFRLGRFAHDAG